VVGKYYSLAVALSETIYEVVKDFMLATLVANIIAFLSRGSCVRYCGNVLSKKSGIKIHLFDGITILLRQLCISS
jgi:hypothetical protein